MDPVSPSNDSAFGPLLRHHRATSGLTQEALADRARISPRAISDLERGVRRYPRRETLRLLFEALTLSVDDRAQLAAAALRPPRPVTRPSRTIARAPDQHARFARMGGFVGRIHELTVFEERLAAAERLTGSVLLLSGEPGIGKSRLLAEVAQRARLDRWLVLSGRAYDVDAMPPYLPFAEALRSYLTGTSTNTSEVRLLMDAPEIANLLPELRDRTTGRLPAPSLGQEADRYRLFEAISKLLEALARSAEGRGLVLCLDDLQWADASTLLLLEHVARRLAAAPFLLVATYRDVSLSETPSLADTLDRLLRERLSHTLSLAPLDVDEVGLMLEGLGGSAPPRELVKAFHHATEGNALFVEEVFQFLLQKGLLFQPSGQWSHDVSLYGDEVPQGIRLVIGSRLRQLGEDCRRVLAAGAAIGRTFRYELLKAITDMDEEAIFDAIEEAQRSHVLTTAPGGSELSFSHDLIRQTLLSELSLPRKQRLHGRIAQAIEEAYSPDIEPHLAELATHWRLANVPSALEKAIDYGVRAAEQASRAFAYREAARLYEQALEALEFVEPNNAERQCDLLLALGGVLLPEGESARVLDSVTRRALNIGKRLEDGERTRLACRLAMEALSRRGMRMVTLTDEWQQWAAEYDHYAGNDSVDRVRLDIDSAERLHMTGHEAEARHRRSSALELARRLGGRDEILYAASFCMYYTQAPSYQQERIRLAEAAAAWPVQGASARTLAFFYLYTGWVYLDWGRRSEAQAAWKCLHDLPHVSPDNFATFFSFFAEGCAAAIEGRLEEVVRLAYGAIPTGDRLGSPIVGQMSAALIAYRPLLHLGRYEEAMRLMESAWRHLGLQEEPAYFKPRRLLALANLGRHSEARRLIEQVLDERGIGPEDDGNVAVADLLPLLESSVLLKDETAAATLCGRLESVAGLIESHVGTNTSVGRHLGDAAVLLADDAQARRRYAQALETCESVRFRPEVALIRLSLGELLARSPGEQAASTDHLDFAEREFREMTMTHALERARAARAQW